MTRPSGRTITVLVTGVGGGSVGHELMQALRRSTVGYRILAADASLHSLGLYEADGRHVLPPAAADAYPEALTQICANEGVDVVIPGSEAELRVISRHREALRSAGVLPLVNADEVIEIGLDKHRTQAVLRAHGFVVPPSLALMEEEQADEVAWFPCVVKPMAGSSGSSFVFIAQDREELRFFASYVRKAGHQPLAQAYVGTAADEFTVGVLHGLDGYPAGSIALRRDILRGLSARLAVPARYPGPHGPTLAVSSGISQGVIEEGGTVRAVCEQIATALGSRGPLNIQLRVVDGLVSVFEVNPRFSGSCHLRALAGFNEPDMLIRHHLLGEPLACPAYRMGRVVHGLTGRFLG